jgi:hypothetical protein
MTARAVCGRDMRAGRPGLNCRRVPQPDTLPVSLQTGIIIKSCTSTASTTTLA